MRAILAGLLLAMILVTGTSSLCVPGVVQSIGLFANNTLRWTGLVNPSNCAIKYYVINVIDEETGIQLQLETAGTSYNVDFLNVCTPYTFEVHAVTYDSVFGPSIKHVTSLPPPSNINLNVGKLNSTVNPDEIDLVWNMADPDIDKCITYYRVVYWDENNNPRDVYVPERKFILKGEIPCMMYHFQVNAFIANPDIQGPINEVITTGFGKVPSPPSVVTLSTTISSVNMVWKTQPYIENHCALTYLDVYTPGAPPGNTLVRFSLNDSVSRPLINITINGLVRNTAYTSLVSLTNIYGASKNVTITYQTGDFVSGSETDLSAE